MAAPHCHLGYWSETLSQVYVLYNDRRCGESIPYLFRLPARPIEHPLSIVNPVFYIERAGAQQRMFSVCANITLNYSCNSSFRSHNVTSSRALPSRNLYIHTHHRDCYILLFAVEFLYFWFCSQCRQSASPARCFVPRRCDAVHHGVSVYVLAQPHVGRMEVVAMQEFALGSGICGFEYDGNGSSKTVG